MISDSGKYSVFGHPDIQIPVEITSSDAYEGLRHECTIWKSVCHKKGCGHKGG